MTTTEATITVLGIPLATFLTFSVIAALITTFGNLLALYLKDILAVRSFEKWKARQALLAAYRKYKEPLFLSAYELSNRLDRLSYSKDSQEEYGRKIDTLYFKHKGKPKNDVTDPYYLKYRLSSNIYRLCSFLYWLEHYREDIVFLDSGQTERNRQLELCLDEIRDDLAGGRINNRTDWQSWKDVLIFKEEQRAIGAQMTNAKGNLIDYATFMNILENKENLEKNRWIYRAVEFFLELTSSKDFRVVRMKMLVVHLTQLMALLGERPLDTHILSRSSALEADLQKEGFELSTAARRKLR